MSNDSPGPVSLFVRLIRTALIVGGIGMVVLIVLMMLCEDQLVYHPVGEDGGIWGPAMIAPEDVTFQSADGTRLHAWYLPAENPTAVILYCHGNAGNVTHRAGIIQALRDHAGASVMVFDYRGYGRSEGKPSEVGILADARAARTALAAKAGVAESDIVMMGRSLGGAVAVDVAAGDGARALVLESTFSSMPDVAAHHVPYLPVHLLMRTRLNSAGKIAEYQGPLLQSHGDADRVVPYQFGRKLFEATGRPESDFITLPGADHNDAQPMAYYSRLRTFLESLKPSSSLVPSP